jgi:hypothetical protein
MPATKVALATLLAEEPWVNDPVIKEIFEPTEPEARKAFSLVDQLRDDDHMLVRALIGSMRSGSLRLGGNMLSRAVSTGYTDQNGTLFDTTKNALATLLTEEPWAKDPALTDNWTNDIEAIARTDMAVAINAVDIIAKYMSGLYHALWYMYREGQELMLTSEFQHLKDEGTGSSYLGKVVLADGRFMPSVRAVFEMMDTNGLGPKHTSLPVPDDAILQKLLEAGESHVFVRRFDSAEALAAFERLLLEAEMRDLGKRLRTLDVKLANALSRHNFA